MPFPRTWREYWLRDQVSTCAHGLCVCNLLQMFKEGVIKTPVGKVFPLEQAAEAVAESQQPGRGEKVLLKG